MIRRNPETPKLIRQRGAALAGSNRKLTSELAKNFREGIRVDLEERRVEVLAAVVEAGKSIRYANHKTKITALRTPDGTTTASRRGMEKVIHDSYSDLFDSYVHLPPHHMRVNRKERTLDEGQPWEHQGFKKGKKNRNLPSPDRIKLEQLNYLPSVLIITPARLFTRFLSEYKFLRQWKTSRTVMLYKKGEPQDISNYSSILQSVIYRLFTRVILNRIERTLDEGQPYEQAGFRKESSTTGHVHTLSKLIELSREYKMSLCLTFIDLKKASDSLETEAVIKALGNQGVPTPYIAILLQLLRGLEWDDMGVSVDDGHLHHLRFADIVLTTSSINQPERMLVKFDETCRKIGLQLNQDKTMFMRNGWVLDRPFTLNATNIFECSSYVYQGREVNTIN
ncbi:hypothetical protein RB195_018132 [Necator americanus]|uniref:Reverse transcriptase domain-containing protein n=1 Tax=Necator americanus TaxID=51031 RepID=A0ABR1CAQ4_NECAM